MHGDMDHENGANANILAQHVVMGTFLEIQHLTMEITAGRNVDDL